MLLQCLFDTCWYSVCWWICFTVDISIYIYIHIYSLICFAMFILLCTRIPVYLAGRRQSSKSLCVCVCVTYFLETSIMSSWSRICRGLPIYQTPVILQPPLDSSLILCTHGSKWLAPWWLAVVPAPPAAPFANAFTFSASEMMVAKVGRQRTKDNITQELGREECVRWGAKDRITKPHNAAPHEKFICCLTEGANSLPHLLQHLNSSQPLLQHVYTTEFESTIVGPCWPLHVACFCTHSRMVASCFARSFT